MGFMSKSRLLDIALKRPVRSGMQGKMGKMRAALGGRGKHDDIDDEEMPHEDEGKDERDLPHYADGGLIGDETDDMEPEGSESESEPEDSDEGPGADDDMGGPETDDDEHAVVGDLVQSGLTHEQSMAIIDAIKALRE